MICPRSAATGKALDFHPRLVIFSPLSAHIAQEEEHVIGNDEVTGSIPVVGSFFSPRVRLPVEAARLRRPQAARNSRRLAMRELISLACEQCKRKNYTTDKNKKNTPSKLQFKKFCPHCGKHTEHKEGSIK